ncbi:MAG: transposase [Deltaproteobacteria bacterium]|nr:transposase [Deltaproteobacteria bacterium]
MKGKRFTEEQIVAILKGSNAGAPTKDLCRRHGDLGGPPAETDRGGPGPRHRSRGVMLGREDMAANRVV